jgi:glycerol-3-phosphate dehydrogenase (NAD(P)+)
VRGGSGLSAAVADADHVVVAVSSAGVPWAASSLAPLLALRPRPVLLLCKGLAPGHSAPGVWTDAFSVALRQAGGATWGDPVAVCGPCIAGELARAVPTVVVFAGRDAASVRSFVALAETDYYRVVASLDAVGAQTCAALKNAYALAVAVASGLHERTGGAPGSVALHNYEAAVFAQAMLEMQAIVAALGGEPASVVGLAGSGDLTVTCNGGRTGRFGRLLGNGCALTEAVERMQGATLECLEVLSVLRDHARPPSPIPYHRLPLLRHLFAVALDGEPLDMPFREFFAA